MQEILDKFGTKLIDAAIHARFQSIQRVFTRDIINKLRIDYSNSKIENFQKNHINPMIC